MIKNYFKIAWRNLYRNKATSFINLIGLSVGMTAAILILFWVQNEMSFNSYHTKAKNIYRITNKINISPNETWIWETSPKPMAEAAKNGIPEIERSARVLPKKNFVLNAKNRPFSEEHGAYVDKSWFDIFDYDFLSGNALSFSQNPFSIILTETKAKKYFGNNDATGQNVLVDNKNYTVAAVIKDNPPNSSFQFDMLIPMEVQISDSLSNSWGHFGYITFLQLRPDANTSLITKKLNTILVDNKKDNSIAASLQPLKNIYFEEGLQSSSLSIGNRKTTYIFSALALLLLLTACINYVNLTTAKASMRSKEVSIRKFAGAKPNSLFYQFLIESLTVSLFALLITLLFIKLSLPAFNTLTEKHLVFSITSVTVWKVLFTTLAIATVLNGIYPAFLLSSFKPLHVFRGQSVLKVKDASLRKALVVFQFTLSVILIIGTIVIFKQLRFLQQSNPGYNASQIITLATPNENTLSYNTFKYDLESESSISGVSTAGSSVINLKSLSSGGADWDGRDTTFNPSIMLFRADEDFKKVLGLQIKEGQWFVHGEKDKHNYILNETAIQQFNLPNPVIGQRFTMNGVTGQIVGVVKDFHYKSMHEKIGPMVISNSTVTSQFFYIKVSPGNLTKALDVIDANWKKHFPSQPFNYMFLDDTFNSTYKADIKISRIILIFSLITIIISALGLFGLSAFTVEQRTKEVGIRKVLGATALNLIILLSKDFVGLVLIAIIIASPIAYWTMHKWLQDFAYRIYISWAVFIAAGAGAIFVALLTVSFHAIKVAITNPVKSLRSE